MKSYTDLEQSKKLAEILPIKSADMMWDDWSLIDEGWKISVGYYPKIEKDYGRKCHPAWSLAALIGLLPNGTVLTKSDSEKYFIRGLLYDNLLDACVDMIFTLKERNLLWTTRRNTNRLLKEPKKNG